ncbi:MAG: restriction endonuclease subunit S [Candidatus Thiodiazotropha sp.]|nr:restriction endonuclease subunit S [Candidatus Thiodiazotropha sp.]
MSEWVDSPLGEVADISSGGTPSRARPSYWGGDVPWVTPSDITNCRTNYLEDTEDTITAKGLASSSAKLLPPGSLLLTSRATIGEVKIAAKAMATNQGFKNLVPSGIDGKFLFYQCQVLKGHFLRFAAGSTFLEINRRDTARIRVPHPISLNTQKKIASVLENIDQAIEKTEALIEKYQQIKAGLMHDLFTRGIGPDGKLRPPREQAPELYQQTPIGWIPKEWTLPELGRYADICSGVTLGAKSSPDQRIRVPYLRVANVQDGYLDITEIKEISVNQRTFDALRLQPGDVLMNEGGDFDKLGRGTVWQGEIEPCIHQNHVFRVRVDVNMLRPFFLAYWSQSEFGKKYFVLSSKQSTNLASINSTQLHKLPVALPSMAEQEAIEGRIRSANKRIDALDAELQKLSKQKSGLMHDLLTGKVEVNPDPPEASHV